jgi:DNA-nicking Smr family endonuclease
VDPLIGYKDRTHYTQSFRSAIALKIPRLTLPNKNNDNQSLPEHVSDDDVDLFQRMMSGVRPLNQDAASSLPHRATPSVRLKKRNEREILCENLEPDVEFMDFESEDKLSFLRPAVGRHTFRKLARGNFNVQSEIDLHGLTTAEAKTKLANFIRKSIARDQFCVRIIHGKGLGSGERGPVLKNKVNIWLRRWDAVLAFVSARQVDGGTGAVYVLLKNMMQK